MGNQLSANDVLPSGIGVNVAYDQGLEYIHEHYMIPRIKIEHSYIYFTKDLFVNESKEVTGHAAYAGFMWAFPGLDSSWGCITLTGMPGATFMFVKNRESGDSDQTVTFSFKTTLGYEYQINVFALQVHFNYNFIIDKSVTFHGIGVSLGFAFKLW